MLQPNEIGEFLGIKATRIHLMGEPIPVKGRVRGLVRKQFGWFLESPLGDDRDLAEHLKWLLDSIDPKRDALRELSIKCRIDLFCAFSSEHGQGGFTFDRVTLDRLATLGVALIVDLYPPGPIEEVGPEPTPQ